MVEIRIHGRGGQGAVLASQILAYSFFLEGKYSQSLPTFGAERRGAPVMAFVRVSDHFINIRSRVTNPHYVIVLSSKLAETVNVTSGVSPEGVVLINSEKPASYYSFIQEKCLVESININSVALKYGLGNRIMPMVNGPIIGAFAKLSGIISLESIIKTLPYFIPAKLEENKEALYEAYELMSHRLN